MPRPTWFILCTALLGTTLAATAQDRFELLSACNAGGSHAEQRKCLELKASESLVTLNSAEKSLIQKLRKVDQEPGVKQRAVAAAQEDAQAFVTYARKHCEAFASLAYGGNAQGDRRLACKIELNNARTRLLSKVNAATL